MKVIAMKVNGRLNREMAEVCRYTLMAQGMRGIGTGGSDKDLEGRLTLKAMFTPENI